MLRLCLAKHAAARDQKKKRPQETKLNIHKFLLSIQKDFIGPPACRKDADGLCPSRQIP
jgi:hypothetical protein